MSKSATLKVRAADPAKPVPIAGVKREVDADGRDKHVIRSEWMDVPNTRYFRKRIQAGDLVEYAPPAAPVNTDSGKTAAKAKE